MKHLPADRVLGTAQIGTVTSELYQEFVRGLAKKMPTKEQTLHHATTGIAGEGGELIDATKKLWIYEKPLTPEVEENLIEEAGDCLFYIQFLCNELGVTLADVIQYNINKLRERYPNGYTNAAALARADKAA